MPDDLRSPIHYQYVCGVCHQWFYTSMPLSRKDPKRCAACSPRLSAQDLAYLTEPPPVLRLTADDREFLRALHIASD